MTESKLSSYVGYRKNVPFAKKILIAAAANGGIQKLDFQDGDSENAMDRIAFLSLNQSSLYSVSLQGELIDQDDQFGIGLLLAKA